MQVVVMACLGMNKSSGRSAERSLKDITGKVSLLVDLFTSKGKMFIFRMLTNHENGTNRMGSTNRERGLLNHLNRSCGCKDMAVRLLGRRKNATIEL